MTEPAKRERAGRDLVALRPDGWALDPPSYDPATGRWSITARDVRPGRGRAPETVTGNGEDDMAAAADLIMQLARRQVDQPAGDWRVYRYVRLRGVNLGMPENVRGLVTFVVFVAYFVVTWGLLIVVEATYKELSGGSSADIFVPLMLVGFGFPPVATALTVPAIRRWVARH